MENPSLRSLEVFAHRVLREAVEAAEHDSTPVEKATNVAALFETYGWLEIGVRFGVFPPREAETLMSWAFPSFYEHLGLLSDLALLPDLRGRLTAARSTKRFFDLPRLAQAAGAVGINQFQLAILDLARFFRNRPAQALTGALRFLDDQGWSDMMEELPDPEEILYAAVGESATHGHSYRSLVHAGWFALAQHIEGFMGMFDPSQEPSAVAHDDWILFKFDVRPVHEWRFDLRNQQMQSRFMQISKSLGQVLAVGGGIEAYADQLVQRWRAFTKPAFLSAGA